MEGRLWIDLVWDHYFEQFKRFVTPENVNASDAHGSRAISLAIDRRQTKCFVHLLKMGADPNGFYTYPDDSEIYHTPLHTVASAHMGYDYDAKGDLWRYAWCLLKKGANVNACNSLGQTPLYVAAEEGKYRTLCTLLEFKADVNATADGTNVLHAEDSPREHHMKCWRAILEAGGALKKTDSPRSWYDGDIRVIQHSLARCRMASRAVARALAHQGKIHRDVISMVAAMVWETKRDPAWQDKK